MINGANVEHPAEVKRAARDNRFVFMLTAKEEEAIQAYRFANRIDTKAEAARSLIEKGLEAVGFRDR